MTPRATPQAGFTLVEMLLSVTLMAMMIAMVGPMINLTRSGTVQYEAHMQIKTAAQKTMNKIQHRLVECKRLFQGTAPDILFQMRWSPDGQPEPISGSVLPVIQPNGSLADPSALSGSTGNMLFLASLGVPEDLSVLNGSGVSENLRIDNYRFCFYYVGAGSGKLVGDKFNRTLWEWESVAYADYSAIMAISDTAKRLNAVSALMNKGFLYACDLSTVTAAGAFYLLNSTGTLSPQIYHMIVRDSGGPIAAMGNMTGSYSYGVSPNTGGTFTPKDSVPKFATASGEFPSGFEVLVTGVSGSRQVVARLVMAASSGITRSVSYEQMIYATVHDVW